ncbi:hypothetical protein BJ742DRAFT_789389 [Cladochytrium replicatum]|nr:hypothetical protein BJ742DRAFT_789389 [Cladochytrium replicatum]
MNIHCALWTNVPAIVVVALAAIVIPIVSTIGRASGGGDSRTSSTSGPAQSTSLASTGLTTTASSRSPYPTLLANGAIFLDPIIRPSSSTLRFNLSSLQNVLATFQRGLQKKL